MTWLLLLTLAQVPATSPPPLVPLDEPVVQTPPPPPPSPTEAAFNQPVRIGEPSARLEEFPATNALQFAPVSLGALYFSVEYERALGQSFSVFGVAGVGLLTQYGFDAGARWYPLENALRGLFLDGRLSVFGLFGGQMLLVGPAVTLGYQWVVNKRLVVSLGAGATLWYAAIHSRTGGGLFLFSGLGSDAQVFLLPGIYQPPVGELGVEPTVRLNLGLLL